MSEPTRNHSILANAEPAKKPNGISLDLVVDSVILEVYTALEQIASHRMSVGQVKTVGRGRHNDWNITGDKRVSHLHFLIDCRRENIFVCDLFSTNGTYVNGKRIIESKVYDGDIIVAGTTSFVVRIVTAASKE